MLHTHDPKDKKKVVAMTSLMIGICLMLVGASFVYNYGTAIAITEILKGDMILLPTLMMIATSFIIFMTSVYKAHGMLFNFKDYDQLMVMPIKTSHLIMSRLLMLYGMNMAFVLIVMLPAGIVYSLFVKTSILFWCIYLMTLIFIPAIPIVVATLIGTVIAKISTYFKHTQIANLILSLALLVGLMVGSFPLQSNEQVAQMMTKLTDEITKLYPVAILYIEALAHESIVALLGFIGLSLGVFCLFASAVGKYFKALHTALATTRQGKRYEMSKLETQTPLKALYGKELRRYLSSSSYILNTSIGLVILTVFSISLMFFNPEQLSSMLELPDLIELLTHFLPIIVSGFVMLTYLTACTISLEGNNLWILKSLPIDHKTIFKSKIIFGLSIVMPVVLINTLILTLALKLNGEEMLSVLVTSVAYGLFNAVIGVVVNLRWPLLDWQNEVTVVKQSAAVMIMLLVGFLSIAVGAGVFLVLGNTALLIKALVITSILGTLTALAYQSLATKGGKQLKRL